MVVLLKLGHNIYYDYIYKPFSYICEEGLFLYFNTTMKTAIILKKLVHDSNAIVESNFESNGVITLTDVYTNRKITINSANTIVTGYFRTNKLRDTFVSVIYNSATSTIAIDAMNKDQYLDIDEMINISISIEHNAYNKYAQIIPLYNYDNTYTIYMQTKTIEHISIAKFDYVRIPFTDELYVFSTINCINTTLNFNNNGRIVSNVSAFNIRIFKETSITLYTTTIDYSNYPDIVSNTTDTITKNNIFNWIWFPEVTLITNGLTPDRLIEYGINDEIIQTLNVNNSKVTKIYKDTILQYPYGDIVVNRIIKSNSNKEYIKTPIVFNKLTRDIYDIPLEILKLTDEGVYTTEVQISTGTKILNLIHSSNITLGNYIRLTYKENTTLFGLTSVLTQSDIDNIKLEDAYFIQVIDLLLDLDENNLYEIIPTTVNGNVNVNTVSDEEITIMNQIGLFINNSGDPTITYIDVVYNGIVYPKQINNVFSTVSNITIHGLYKVIEKYQNVLEVTSYTNLKVSTFKMDDNKVFVSMNNYNELVAGDKLVLPFEDGIFKIVIEDEIGIANHIMIAYPSILTGNVKYLKSLLEEVPQNPHKTYYDFNVFITLKDTLMKKLNNMYAFQYVYSDISDELLADLYTMKQIVDNLKKYVSK